MPMDTNAEVRKLAKPGAPPPEQEHLPCPRCDSTNTKFCYYNNYNFSQPRHFCKSCRRYWTHGGTLRDIPVGGGTRKNAKRSRTSACSSALMAGSLAATAAAHQENIPLTATPVLLPLAANQGLAFGDHGKGGNAGGGGAGGACGSFTSLLSTQGPGFLALGGFGLGIGPGFEDVGFGLGRGVWAFPGVGDGGAGVGGGNGAVAAAGLGGSWQFENGENGFVGGDCFPWPELAISTPGNGLK
ncbi:hypothetical protein Tsubulata_009876 [Turnera subulata]|uniref:Dof zinc finger protein n=1 Tax=Turnera subulata TaxID=218843 RepID=A0A9Q0JHZ2_9ROSI|nr:hypothetical protein Tsubulata_009876 [Turnera subulata]